MLSLKNSLSLGLGLLLFISCNRPIEAHYSHVAIEEGDSEKEILWKAAHVVPSNRQYNWQRLELTAFAHFGMNTFTGNTWGNGEDNPRLFNPSNLDAEQWVSVLKEAGFRSLILTCKHHDGFCLWPSAYTDYSVLSSPWKEGQGDVVKEVSLACQKYDLQFGFYLSPWDRHDHRYGTPEYNDYFVNQLTELLSNYGPICEVWLDGACGEGPNGKKQEYDFDRWYKVIRKLQPKCVIAVMGPDVRWVGTENGRGRETEWSVVPNDRLNPELIAESSQHEVIMPPTGVTRGEDLASREIIRNAKTLVWYPAESDVSIRPSWFYLDKDEGRTKSGETLMDIYFTSVGRNSNLLLNVPPDKSGRIAPAEVKSLMDFARIREKTFETNLLEDAKIRIATTSQKACKRVCDSEYETSLRLKLNKKGECPVMEWKWEEEKCFSILLLQEDIRHGQRIEQFCLEYKGGDGNWHIAAEGTTVGYKRLLRFEPICAREVRIRFGECRYNPIISEVGLY